MWQHRSCCPRSTPVCGRRLWHTENELRNGTRGSASWNGNWAQTGTAGGGKLRLHLPKVFQKSTLLSARKTAYALVQDSTKPLARCLAELLDFAEVLQGQIGALPTATEKMDFRSVFQNPELINPQWPEKVAAGDLTAPVGESHFGRQIAMYFLFRYFLNLGLEGDVLSAAKMAAVGVLVPTYFGTDSWVMHLWSKETEHSDVNMERYRRLLRTADCLSVPALKFRLDT